MPRSHRIGCRPRAQDLVAAESPTEPSAADALWRFSLDFYARPGVCEALIALQDRDGRDVNLMLFALWLGLSGRPLFTSPAVAAAEREVATIRAEIAEPLRRVRRRLKREPAPDIQDLRRRIEALEIEAEKAAQLRLAATAGVATNGLPLAARLSAAAGNLATYLGPVSTASAEAAALLRSLAAFAQEGDWE